MKTVFPRVNGKSFLIALALASLLSLSLSRAQSDNSVQSVSGLLSSTAVRSNQWVVAMVKPVGNSSQFRVVIANPGRVSLQLIVRKDSKTVYEQYLTAKQYHQLINLTDLGDGTFDFEVRTPTEHYTQAFAVQTNSSRSVTRLTMEQPSLVGNFPPKP